MEFHIQRTVAKANNPKNASVMSDLGVDITVSSIDYISRMIEREVDPVSYTHLDRIRLFSLPQAPGAYPFAVTAV